MGSPVEHPARTESMDGGFHKRVFTPKIFFTDIAFLMSRFPQIIAALRNKAISRAFMEKIMTVTTVVNGCVYCTWFHAKVAVESGISEEEVSDMLNLQFEANGTEFETMALLYAQHYAETNRNPDADMTAKLFDYYGERTAQHIILFIRMIFFGNLLAPTTLPGGDRHPTASDGRAGPASSAVWGSCRR